MFEYTDMENAQLALTGLSGLPVGKGKLIVQRVPAMMAATLLKPVKVGTVVRRTRRLPVVACIILRGIYRTEGFVLLSRKL